ncbi:hypothetical protein GGI15_001039 [Coemansia interrupta]|uniref:GATA-type domain-containing protein n=1 Tax=Coemansia interrupta TaxID=1126814 RepID=A0A9W8HIU2_9FUNG|nr:hypothetical protein GGI15_001039 [Coemansia interrupta]
MDLNLVCGPAAAAAAATTLRKTQESQMMEAVGMDNTTAPLPSVHELENIRVSLDENDIVATEATPLHKPASSLSVSGSESKLASAPNSLITPPNSASHGNVGMTANTSDMRQERSENSDNKGSSDIIKTGGTADKLALPGDVKRRTSILEKYHAELLDVAEKCKILSQFSEQYGPEKNKFNAQPSDDLVIDMARKAYEVLMVFMTIRRERMSTSADDDTMEYIRKRRTVLSPTRSKSRKRSKRSDAAQPNTCRSCGISETPEWRRGPDGARTLCNACGLHYAKLNKKRATEANTHFSADIPGGDAVSKAKAAAPNGDDSAIQGSTIIANPHAGAAFPHHYHYNHHINHHAHTANPGQPQPQQTAQYVYPPAMQNQNQTHAQHGVHSAVPQQQHYHQQQQQQQQIHRDPTQHGFPHQNGVQTHYAGSLATPAATAEATAVNAD